MANNFKNYMTEIAKQSSPEPKERPKSVDQKNAEEALAQECLEARINLEQERKRLKELEDYVRETFDTPSDESDIPKSAEALQQIEQEQKAKNPEYILENDYPIRVLFLLYKKLQEPKSEASEIPQKCLENSELKSFLESGNFTQNSAEWKSLMEMMEGLPPEARDEMMEEILIATGSAITNMEFDINNTDPLSEALNFLQDQDPTGSILKNTVESLALDSLYTMESIEMTVKTDTLSNTINPQNAWDLSAQLDLLGELKEYDSQGQITSFNEALASINRSFKENIKGSIDAYEASGSPSDYQKINETIIAISRSPGNENNAAIREEYNKLRDRLNNIKRRHEK